MYIDKDTNLAFIDSKSVKVFPCGRRRNQLIDTANDNKTDGYIPFDPEARLNTEANNRKHSSLNGFKQSYINKFENKILSIVIGGYLFDINLTHTTLDSFAKSFASDIGADDAIYANIKLEDITLYSSTTVTPEYRTTILRNQTATEVPATCLDLKYTDGYYFSGLSLSSSKNIPEETATYQKVIPLKILENKGNSWQMCKSSLLPKIEHGDAEDSIKVTNVQVTGGLEVKGKPVVALEVVASGDKNRLKLTTVSSVGS
jgi:hypothetical protein